MPLSGGLGELLGQAVAPPEVGRRYPRIGTAPQGLDINGEVLQPSDLPNPSGMLRVDPLDQPYLRPQIDTMNGPQFLRVGDITPFPLQAPAVGPPMVVEPRSVAAPLSGAVGYYGRTGPLAYPRRAPTLKSKLANDNIPG